MTVSPVRRWLTLGVSTAALFAAQAALAQTTQAPAAAAAKPAAPKASDESNQIEEIVVTAERRETSLQDTPVAVSAFSGDALKAQRLDGGENLVLSIPNVTYSRSNFGGYNFQIRGIGTQLVTNSGEAGVSFNVNELPLAINHFGDTDFYDVERVEVLRGPQGTLFGRTATGGAVNVITNKPTDVFSGSVTSEFGNFDDKKVTGFLNVPVNDFFQFRLAGFFLDRGGYGTNVYNGDSVDGRNLNSFRVTTAFKFNDRLKATLLFEDFNEKDDRNRIGKQLCDKDPGPDSIGGVPTNAINRGFFSQGCRFTSPYSDASYGTTNSQATTGGIFAAITGLQTIDAYQDHPLQNHNLHDIESVIDPVYEAKQRVAILQLDWDLTDNLKLSSITAYNRETHYDMADYNRVVASNAFSPTPTASSIFPGLIAQSGVPLATAQAIYGGLYQGLFPGGVVSDPQVGARNRFTVFDRDDGASDEKTEEIRVSSSFKGPLNFSAGAILVNEVVFSDYYVFFNPLTAFIQAVDTLSGDPSFAGSAPGSYAIDPNSTPNATGHNYFNSRYGDTLNSYAAFGEVTYKPIDDLRITAGFRYTVDHKKGLFYPALLFAPGSGVGQYVNQRVSFEEPTARFNVEWTPHLPFTDRTLVYFNYAHGYKSGGFNTPTQDSQFNAVIPDPFQPELVDTYEVGTKNTLFNRTLELNLTGFFYNYNGYQISTIRNKASFNSNTDAQIYGLELESIWRPIRPVTLNANVGYLHTEIIGYSQYDPSNPTDGHPEFSVVKDSSGGNCIVNTAALAQVLAILSPTDPLTQLGGIVGIPGVASAPGLCNGGGALGAIPNLYNYGSVNVTTQLVNGRNVGIGVVQNLDGKELPNSPDLTVSIGAQYEMDLPAEWKATVRGDFYWQDDSYSRFFNSDFDKLKGYENLNATLTFDNAKLGVNLQLFVKNLTDSQPFTGYYITDPSSGLFHNTFTLDPRTYGVSLTKRF